MNIESFILDGKQQHTVEKKVRKGQNTHRHTKGTNVFIFVRRNIKVPTSHHLSY